MGCFTSTSPAKAITALTPSTAITTCRRSLEPTIGLASIAPRASAWFVVIVSADFAAISPTFNPRPRFDELQLIEQNAQTVSRNSAKQLTQTRKS